MHSNYFRITKALCHLTVLYGSETVNVNDVTHGGLPYAAASVADNV